MNPCPGHLIAAIFLALSAPFAVSADNETESTPTKAPRIPNVSILNQDGAAVRFYDDLIKGKVVAINFVFTTCPTICPLMQVNFAQLQKQLKNGVAKDVRLISVTVDPVTDTPARLKQWSKAFEAQEGWTFVTGQKASVDRILKSLEVFTADKNDHPSFILIGDEARGDWKRVDSLAPPATLARELSRLAAPPAKNSAADRKDHDAAKE